MGNICYLACLSTNVGFIFPRMHNNGLQALEVGGKPPTVVTTSTIVQKGRLAVTIRTKYPERWRYWSPPPAVAHVSTHAGWQGAELHQIHTAEVGAFESIQQDFVLCWMLDPYKLHVKGYGSRHVLRPKPTLMLPGENYRGVWEGSRRGICLFLNKDLIRVTTGYSVDRIIRDPNVLRRSKDTMDFDSPQIEHLLRIILSDVVAKSPDGPTLGEQIIVRLVGHLFSEPEPRASSANKVRALKNISNVLEYIHEHLKERLTLRELALMFGMSTRNLCRVFRVQLDLTPHEYIQKCRVEKACMLIAAQNMSLAEIAVACGFSDQSHMTVTFQKVLGFTPSHFRNS